ncbi:hypothetical protein JZ751_017205 [Albula glossodonta]|uniref:Cytochrome P450 n=1 Tax=Albula glossodonta TaxID=121402 RepID=A0A8T2MQF1_9TELE|nr:hypothetical protein JZ751_017205 [Albula glossodonta]
MLEFTRAHLPNHLTSLAHRYGNIYRLHCGNTSDIVSGGGRSISLGDYSEEWRTHRRLTHSALQRCSLQSLHSAIQKQALHLRQVLLDYNETPVDLSEDFTVASSNVITTLVFGKEYDKSSPELQRLHGCLNEIVSLWGSSWISALDSYPLLRDEGTGGVVTASLLQTVDQPLGETERVMLTETHVHMATVDLLIGGTETTAAWLCWTVAFLLHRPERFLDGGGASTRALLPFGGGARLCLGESIAKMELFLFTAYLLRDFQFLPSGNKESLPDLTGVAIKNKGNLEDLV